MPRPFIAVTFAAEPARRAVISAAAAKGGAEIAWLPDLDPEARRAALAAAGAVIARHTSEFAPGELPLIKGVRLLQFTTAGVDYIPLRDVPAGVPIASNRGSFNEPMAEHAVAMALAAAKRLLVEHANLKHGAFNQFVENRMLAGGVAGIFGFGGIGQAAGRKFAALGMRIHALNRSGRTGAPVEWIGDRSQLETMLAASDVLVITAPLTQATRGAIGERQLARMKEDAILVNLARGEIVDQAALFRHLQTHPRFTACLDAWWVEPIRHGAFRLDYPFLDLPNVIGSPHNSAHVPGNYVLVLEAAVANCLRAIAGEPPQRIVPEDERLF
jgi:phosphoglycerate dehydrogenase-like enzyme